MMKPQRTAGSAQLDLKRFCFLGLKWQGMSPSYSGNEVDREGEAIIFLGISFLQFEHAPLGCINLCFFVSPFSQFVLSFCLVLQ